ncbi:M56 family metallopeptidase [Streptomyces sp. P9(2023)]|uniref:M56 family metallopeptidase n=1 Tax=Streptomyces sp. P9(2023) TaxID=3064394 RepID=UPI0028F40B5A|nr:M56 family metallopeptidase [Streptomyces sp. P9(2023)]MDT9692099.1 M56 family metallopeptidase [Streptomyces sp. P9(2023)]
MTGVVPVALYVIIVALLVPPLLRRARWVVRAPRVAITLWLALPASALMGSYLLGCRLTEAAAWGCCRPSDSGTWEAAAGLLPLMVQAVLWVAVPGWVIGVVCLDACLMWRRRRRHAETLDLLGDPLFTRGCRALAIDHHAPAVYCVAAKGGRVVLTTAALDLLSDRELSAVVEHEKAHLRGHHSLLTTAAASVARALPTVPVFSYAGPEVARLVEMAADDAAARRVSKEFVARGLARLVVTGGALEQVAPVALGATGADAAERINRLLDLGNAERKRSAAAGGGALMALVAIPASAAVAVAAYWC